MATDFSKMKNDGSKNIRIVSCIAVILLTTVLSCRSSQNNLNSSTDNKNASEVAGGLSNVKEYEEIKDSNKARFDHYSQSHKVGPNEIIKDCNFCHQRAESDPTDPQVKHSPPHNVFVPYHDSCEACHNREDFVQIKKGTINKSPLCGVCHQEGASGLIDTSTDLPKALLISYPEKQDQFGLAGLSNDVRGFSHKDHLDPQKMSADAGLAKCSTCHMAADAIRLGFPKHQECFLCHTHQAGQKLGECGVCHTVKASAVKYSADMGTALSLYNFKHGPHTKKASCEKCHQIAQARFENLFSDVMKISTSRGQRHNSTCWNCHIQKREPLCTKCHVGSLPF